MEFRKKRISKLMMSTYSEMKVGNEVVLQVFVENGSLQCRWCDTSSAWEELQNSPEISEMRELGKRD